MNKLLLINGKSILKLYSDLPNEFENQRSLVTDIGGMESVINSESLGDLKLNLFNDYNSKLYNLSIDDTFYDDIDIYGMLVITNERSQGLSVGYLASYNSDEEFVKVIEKLFNSLSNHTTELKVFLNDIKNNKVRSMTWIKSTMDYLAEVLNYKFVDFKNI